MLLMNFEFYLIEHFFVAWRNKKVALKSIEKNGRTLMYFSCTFTISTAVIVFYFFSSSAKNNNNQFPKNEYTSLISK